MFINYFKVAIRNLMKNKVYSFINILGLAVGIACCIAILLYVRDELSYDKFNIHGDQIYRLCLNLKLGNTESHNPESPPPMGAALLHDFPEVLSFTRIRKFGFPVLRYKNKTFSEERFFQVDSTFFNVFTVKFLEGDPKVALTQPNNVVITESMAKKYFGNKDPMGKILNADRNTDWIVTGVVQDVPKNSHFHYDFLGSLTSSSDSRSTSWLSNNYYTYLLLRKGTDAEVFQKKINSDILKYVGPQIQAITSTTLNQLRNQGDKYEYFLQPLLSIHLHSHLDYEIERNSDISYVYIFSIIAVVILLIACINFINLETARSEKRAKEVGIRKTLGSNRSQIVGQFIAEAVLMSMLAVMLAVVLDEIFLPLFNNIAGKEMSASIFENIYSIPLLLIFAILVGIFAGSYPAFYLSSFQPVKVLKSELRRGNRKSVLRSSLVIFQFAVSIALFICTFIINNQLKYIQTKNLGFNKEQVVIISKTDDIGNQIQSFEKGLLANPDVLKVSNSSAIPGNQGGNYSGCSLKDTPGSQLRDAMIMTCDENFAEVYKLKMKQGRFFSVEYPSDTAAIVVNEALTKSFGVKHIIGKYLVFPGDVQTFTYQIIGVVKNFNYESLHKEIRPLAIRLYPERGFGQFVSVRIAPNNYQSTISFLQNTWRKYAGNEAFEYNFLDKDLANLYLNEQRTSNIATIFSVLAIFIACLGLLGLAAFVTEQRTKEIGIRKSLGASVPEIVILLSKEFTKWVLVANAIAWPLAYFIMNYWLMNFAYRITITPWVFIISGIIALLIALLTVSIHAIRAATANPILSLRYE